MTARGFDRDPPPSGPVVRAIGAAGFTVDGIVYPGLLLTPEAAMPWDPPALDSIGLEHLEPLLRLDPPPEFLILGTGPAMRLAPQPLARALDERGIGIEAMDSRAAARTWGVLRQEERWIGAALMPLA